LGEQGQILTISRTLDNLPISGICKEKSAKYGPFSRRCSRIILRPAGDRWCTLSEVNDFDEVNESEFSGVLFSGSVNPAGPKRV